MDRERLSKLLQDPVAASGADLAELSALGQRYPWAGGVRLLKAVAEAQAALTSSAEPLLHTAAHIPSRAVLYDLLHTEPRSVELPKSSPAPPATSAGEPLAQLAGNAAAPARTETSVEATVADPPAAAAILSEEPTAPLHSTGASVPALTIVPRANTNVEAEAIAEPKRTEQLVPPPDHRSTPEANSPPATERTTEALARLVENEPESPAVHPAIDPPTAAPIAAQAATVVGDPELHTTAPTLPMLPGPEETGASIDEAPAQPALSDDARAEEVSAESDPAEADGTAFAPTAVDTDSIAGNASNAPTGPAAITPEDQAADDALDRLFRSAATAGGSYVEELQRLPEAEPRSEQAEPNAPASVPSAAQPAPDPARMRFTDWLQQLPEPENERPAPLDVPHGKTTAALPQDPTATRDLIDRFIQRSAPPPAKKAEFFTPQQAAKRSLENNDDLVSETLASILAKQGSTAKAIQAYIALAQRHPERADHFNALIAELRKR